MNAELSRKIDLMEKNYRVINKSAKLDYSQMVSLGALLFTSLDKEANEEIIRANRKLVKSKTGLLSNFRGIPALALLAKMSFQDDPDAYLDKVLKAYDYLVEGKVLHSEFLVLTAITIADYLEPNQYEDIVCRTRELIKKMRSVHPLLTSESDTSLAALLLINDINVEQALNESEACYQYLKGDHFKLSKDSLQSVSHVLALSPKSVEEKCQIFHDYRAAMKQAGHTLHADGQLAILAGFVDIDLPIDQVVALIGEVDDELKHRKGFGAVACGAQLRRLYAATLVLEQLQEAKFGSAVDASKILASSIAQEIVQTIITTLIICAIIISMNTHH